MHCVYYVEPRPYNAALWMITPAGLVVPAGSQSEAVDTASTTSPDAKLEEDPQPPLLVIFFYSLRSTIMPSENGLSTSTAKGRESSPRTERRPLP